MTRFTGHVGMRNGVYEWSDVIEHSGVIVEYTTQFGGRGGYFPGPGDDVTIDDFGSYTVRISSGTYRHWPSKVVGAGNLTLAAGQVLDQSHSGFTMTGSLTNSGSFTANADTVVTGRIQNNHLISVAGQYTELKLSPVAGDFTLTGAGELRLVGGTLTGNGGPSSITDLFNHSRISGYGTIGVGPNWSGGYLVIHNEASGVIEANTTGEALVIETQTSHFNPVFNEGDMLASGDGILRFRGGNGPIFVEQSGAGRIAALNEGIVELYDAVVSGGELHTEGTGVILNTGPLTRLSDLEITRGSNVHAGRVLYLEGTIENRGTIHAGEHDGYLRVGAQGLTLTGKGLLSLANSTGLYRITGEAPGAVLTNVDNLIAGEHNLEGSNLTVVNHGRISARDDGLGDGRDALELNSLAGLTNTGILEALSNATLRIKSPSSMTADNTDGVIQAVGAGARVELYNLVLSGGVLHSAQGGAIDVEGSTTRLSDLSTTNTTVIDAGRNVTLEGDVANRGQIVVTESHAYLVVGADGLNLSGGGRVTLGSDRSFIVGEAAGAVLTNNNLITGRGGQITGANLSVVNTGTIRADGASNEIEIYQLASFANSGTLEAVNGAKLDLGGSSSAAMTFHSAGGTIRADGAGSIVDLGYATIAGGSLVAVNGGRFEVSRATFDGRAGTVSSNADLHLLDGEMLTLKGAIASSGDITLTRNSTLAVGENTTLSGGGTIFLNGYDMDCWIVAGTAGRQLVNLDNTIGGGGFFGNGSGLVFTNGANGVVSANQAGETLFVRTGNAIRNDGLMIADGSVLDILDRVTGTGTLGVTNGGRLIVDRGTDQDVSFRGAGADTLDLSLRDNGGATGFDFDVSGMGVGDRVRLDAYGNWGAEAAFRFVHTASGATLTSDVFKDANGQAFAVRLEGSVSEGQFRLVAHEGRFTYERVATRDGTANADALRASATGERVIGLGGDDTLMGGAGDDLLDGSLGFDTADYRFATGGVSVSLAAVGSQAVGGGMGSDRFISIENLTGSRFADALTGSAGNNVLKGGAGADSLNGGTGRDAASYEGATRGVTASLTDPSRNAGDAKGDTYSSIENLFGSSFADGLTGDGSFNVLSGGGGDDKLDGAAGRDTLTGGAGNDTFQFTAALTAGNVDAVEDFAAGDRFELSARAFTGLVAGTTLSAHAFVVGTQALGAEDRIIYNSVTGAVLFDRDGAGGAAAVQFALLDPGLPRAVLSASDFVVID